MVLKHVIISLIDLFEIMVQSCIDFYIFLYWSLQFEVERSVDTRVEICCAGKPGLILSTVNTLEALGLEIQQCVISCFNDFTMQASCSEVHYYHGFWALPNISYLVAYFLFIPYGVF